MKAKGVKHDPNAIVRVAKDRTGRIVFLEKGRKSAETTRPAGLAHILEEHGDDFARVGVPEAEVPDLVMRAVTEGKVVGTQGRPPGRPIHEITHKGKRLHIAVTVGSNGYIVGANPTSIR